MSTNSNQIDDLQRHSAELEYATLRAEILKRIEMRQQIVSIALTFAGIFLGFGLENDSLALIYPPIAMFLALSWSQNDFRIRDQARYIREKLETAMPGLGYETFVQEKRLEAGGMRSWRFVVLSHGGLFLVTQVIAIGIELSKFTLNTLDWVLLALDIIAVMIVIWLMIGSGRKTQRY